MANDRKHFVKQEKIALFQTVARFPCFIFVVISAIASNALFIWIDAVERLCGFIQNTLVNIFSRKLKKNLKFDYNYGTGKVEAIISICCDIFSIVALGCADALGVYQIIFPEKPSSFNAIVVFLISTNLIIDSVFVYLNKNNAKSRMIKSLLSSNIETIAFDTISFAMLFVTGFFSHLQFTWYISPVLAVIVSTYFIIQNFKSINRSLGELTDKTLPEDVQLKVVKTLTKYYDCYVDCVSVNSHLVCEEMHIELNLVFEESMTYSEIKSLLTDISAHLNKEVGKCKVNFIISQ